MPELASGDANVYGYEIFLFLFAKKATFAKTLIIQQTIST